MIGVEVMINKSVYHMTRCVVGGVALLFLAGCIDLKVGAKKTKLKVSANDVVLAKINQEPVITNDNNNNLNTTDTCNESTAGSDVGSVMDLADFENSF